MMIQYQLKVNQMKETNRFRCEKKVHKSHPAIKEYTHKEAVEMAQQLSKQGGNH